MSAGVNVYKMYISQLLSRATNQHFSYWRACFAGEAVAAAGIDAGQPLDSLQVFTKLYEAGLLPPDQVEILESGERVV